MRSPGHHDLRSVSLLVLLDGDQVCKCLERMSGRSLHTEHRFAGVLDELVDYHLVVVVLLALELSESTDADHVAVAAHHRNRLKQVLRLVTVHNHSVFCLQLPRSLVHVQDDHVHSQIKCGLLCAESGAEA